MSCVSDCGRGPTARVSVRSLDLGHLVEYHLDEGPVDDGAMDLATAAIERLGVPGGVDVQIRSDAPPGSGLGGSSALVTAVVAALALLGERRFSPEEVARLAYRIEREDLGIAGGWQDQFAAAFGGFNLLDFSASGVSVEPVRISPEDARAPREPPPAVLHGPRAAQRRTDRRVRSRCTGKGARRRCSA